MKKILSILAISGLLFMSTSCNFLDVYPEDRLLREQVLGSRAALHNVLNGVYMEMMNNNLYGADLTQTTVEVLAQRFDLRAHGPESIWQTLRQYHFEEAITNMVVTRIWEAMWRNILQVNYFMDLMNNATVHFPEHHRNMLMGEAMGLRAMFHFDLLRLFGPVPELATDEGIMPYNYLIGETRLLPLLSAREVLDHVIADLAEAQRLLQDSDYIITQGINRTITFDAIANFYTNRNHRMNYYAVRALQARVFLWADQPAAAEAAARAVITAPLVASGQLFPWVTHAEATRTQDPDRIFSSEVIFGFRNIAMYTNFNAWFGGALLPSQILNPNTSRLEEVFSEPADLRFEISRTWQIPPDRTYRTSFRFAEPAINRDTTFGFFQPLIRISEMYLILAEVTGNVDYLHILRNARQLTAPVEPGNLMAAIEQEYAREFWGEGQLFFFYKRRNVEAIPNALNPASAGRDLIMLPENYRLPLPRVETDRR